MKQRNSHRQIRRNRKNRAAVSRMDQWMAIFGNSAGSAESDMIAHAGMTTDRLISGAKIPGLPFGGNVMRLRHAAKMAKMAKMAETSK